MGPKASRTFLLTIYGNPLLRLLIFGFLRHIRGFPGWESVNMWLGRFLRYFGGGGFYPPPPQFANQAVGL